MRTKAIIMGAALLAAGVASSMAQSNVYSLNVVGYTTIHFANGFNQISNPLDVDGAGTHNTITTAFGAQLPNLTSVYKYQNGSFGSSDIYLTGVGWLSGGTITLNPGEGLFVQIPAVGDGGPVGGTNITFVGSVLQGSLTNNYIAGYNILSSKVPVAGGVTSTLNFQPSNLDSIYVFDRNTQSYPTSYLYITGFGWTPSEPTFAVGDAFWLQTGAAVGGSWTTNFTVH